MRAAILVLLVPLAAQAFFFGNSCGCQQRCPAPACPLPPAPVCPPPPVCGGGGSYAQAPIYRPQQVQVVPQQQYFQQQPVVGYAQPQQQQPAEFGDEALAAQSEHHESFNGQSATLEEEQPAAIAPSAPSSVSSSTADVATPVEEPAVDDVNDVQPQAGATAAQNTVYDDIVNAAQGSTPAEEYQAAAQATRRHRYRSIRRAPATAFDPKCNSETLKTIIHNNIGDSTSSSKRAIQKAASEEIGGHVDVICSTGTFSYIVNTELYCETEKDGITCFAFRQSN